METRRVLVIHKDRSQRVYDVKDDLTGSGKFDMDLVISRLLEVCHALPLLIQSYSIIIITYIYSLVNIIIYNPHGMNPISLQEEVF